MPKRPLESSPQKQSGIEEDQRNFMVGDAVRYTQQWIFSDGVSCSSTRCGKIIARNGRKVICALANFGSIDEFELDIDQIEPDDL